jgi:hypothetical protein
MGAPAQLSPGETRRVRGGVVDAEVLAAWGLEVYEREPVDIR